jgi:hypothetical protein
VTRSTGRWNVRTLEESRSTLEFNNPRLAELCPVTEESETETETMVASADGATEKRVRFADENDLWEFNVDSEKADSEAVLLVNGRGPLFEAK